MTTTQQTVVAGVPMENWERLAELANAHQGRGGRATAERMRNDYVRTVEEIGKHPNGELVVERPKPKTLPGDRIHVGPYEIKLYSVFALGIEGDFQPGADWSFDLKAYLKVLGETVWTTEYQLSPENASITYHPDVYLAKGDFTIGIFGSTHCLRTYGDACYRVPFGSWHCKDFDETLYCFG